MLTGGFASSRRGRRGKRGGSVKERQRAKRLRRRKGGLKVELHKRERDEWDRNLRFPFDSALARRSNDNAVFVLQGRVDTIPDWD